MYGADTWSTTKSQEKSMDVNKTMMLWWMCVVTKNDKIRNEHVRGSVKVLPVTKNITEKTGRDEVHVVRRMLDAKNVRCTSTGYSP